MITMSKRAIGILKNTLHAEKGKAILLYLKSGGCTGMEYKFEIMKTNNKSNKLDEIIKVDDLNIHLCNNSLLYMLGTHIDYIDDIMGTRFDFKNDKIKNKCGCGSSVNFD